MIVSGVSILYSGCKCYFKEVCFLPKSSYNERTRNKLDDFTQRQFSGVVRKLWSSYKNWKWILSFFLSKIPISKSYDPKRQDKIF